MTEMSQEIAVSPVFTTLPEAPRADSDTQLLEIWLHGRSRHTQRAYRADVEHFLAWVRKPLLEVTLADLQQYADSLGELAPASRYRTLSSIKSLLGFAHRTGYLPYDVGRALRLPIPKRARITRAAETARGANRRQRSHASSPTPRRSTDRCPYGRTCALAGPSQTRPRLPTEL